MKIGIITFHRAENFGAVMQCYALQTYLLQQGHDVQVIDYRYKKIERGYHVFNPSLIFAEKGNKISQIRNYLGRLKTWRKRIYKKRQYSDFRKKYLQQTAPSHTIKKYEKDFEAIIVGSDQVWNTILTGGIDSAYFLEGTMAARKIAYAVSTEKYSYSYYKIHADRLSALINDFNAVSVREEDFRNELRKYTNTSISVCVDPVFLLNRMAYQIFLSPPNEKDYILVYHLIDSAKMSAKAKELGEKHHKKVIELHAGFSKQTNGENITHRCNIGLIELLSYIAYADMVVTTSFHGLAFSIIFRKSFWIIDNGSTSRQRHLLSALGLEHRIIQENDSIVNDSEKIDYTIIERNIHKLIDNSVKYLTKSLENNE